MNTASSTSIATNGGTAITSADQSATATDGGVAFNDIDQLAIAMDDSFAMDIGVQTADADCGVAGNIADQIAIANDHSVAINVADQTAVANGGIALNNLDQLAIADDHSTAINTDTQTAIAEGPCTTCKPHCDTCDGTNIDIDITDIDTTVNIDNSKTEVNIDNSKTEINIDNSKTMYFAPPSHTSISVSVNAGGASGGSSSAPAGVPKIVIEKVDKSTETTTLMNIGTASQTMNDWTLNYQGGKVVVNGTLATGQRMKVDTPFNTQKILSSRGAALDTMILASAAGEVDRKPF